MGKTSPSEHLCASGAKHSSDTQKIIKPIETQLKIHDRTIGKSMQCAVPPLLTFFIQLLWSAYAGMSTWARSFYIMQQSVLESGCYLGISPRELIEPQSDVQGG